ncbi:MAG: CheR family methyltransferase [Nanoarchaeota archaeon]
MFSSPNEFKSYVNRYYDEGTWLKFVREFRKSLLGIPLEHLVREFHCQGLEHRTSFFSEELIRAFDRYLLPRLQENDAQGNPTRILSLPCSSGQEVYSLATLAWDQGFRDFIVEGRDVSENLINKARSGEYWMKPNKDKLEPFIEKGYFWARKKGRKHNYLSDLEISPSIVQRCNFEVQDILLDVISTEYDAILCFNLFMHLSSEGREVALSNLTTNLRSGDLLFLGESYQVNRGYQQGWNLERDRMSDYNQFVGELEKRDEGEFRKMGESNVYRRV